MQDNKLILGMGIGSIFILIGGIIIKRRRRFNNSLDIDLDLELENDYNYQRYRGGLNISTLNDIVKLEIEKYKNDKKKKDIIKLLEFKSINPSISLDDASLKLLKEDITYNLIIKDNTIIEKYN